MKKKLFLLLFVTGLAACKNDTHVSDENTSVVKTEELVPTIEYTIVSTLPHDTLAYTEGLLFHNDNLYESTGSPESAPDLRSVIGIVDKKTGKINVKAELNRDQYFGEGIVILNDKIYQLTYKNQTGFIYDAKTYKLIGNFSYKNKEGWGLTTDGRSIIMSDGTNMLTYLDPQTLKPSKTLNVTNGGYAEDHLNELEYIDGFIYANIWTKNYIVKIHPETGKVVGLLDLSPVVDDAYKKNPEVDVLNGIAYDSISKKVFVTGKLYRDIYEIAFSL
jgi:glutaminyl-peptide cyclotransferase